MFVFLLIQSTSFKNAPVVFGCLCCRPESDEGEIQWILFCEMKWSLSWLVSLAFLCGYMSFKCTVLICHYSFALICSGWWHRCYRSWVYSRQSHICGKLWLFSGIAALLLQDLCSGVTLCTPAGLPYCSENLGLRLLRILETKLEWDSNNRPCTCAVNRGLYPGFFIQRAHNAVCAFLRRIKHFYLCCETAEDGPVGNEWLWFWNCIYTLKVSFCFPCTLSGNVQF